MDTERKMVVKRLFEKISIRNFYLAIVVYLYLPLLVFAWGWVKFYIATPVVLITAVAIVFSMKNIYKNNQEKTTCTVLEILVTFIMFSLFFVVAGHSDLFAQDYDWHKHHAVFNDLLNYEWPVVYSNNVMFTYYFGQYLIPVFVGKIFHSSLVMKSMIPVWNALGTTIVYAVVVYLLKVKTNGKKIIIFLALILWGGCTSLGSLIYNAIYKRQFVLQSQAFKWIDMFAVGIHFAGNYDALHDAFQHVITPWLSVCFFLGNKKHYESYMMIAVPLIFSATFAFIYLVPILLFFAVWGLKKTELPERLKSIFSLGNILMLPLVGLLFVYFFSYLFSDKPDSMGFRITKYGDYWGLYFIFVFAEFLVYSIFLFQSNKKNILFYVINLELLLVPLFSLGMCNDLCSRGSIPARFILMVLCLELLLSKPRINWRSVGLTLVLTWSLYNTAWQFYFHMLTTYSGYYKSDRSSFLSDNFKTLEGFAGNPQIRDDEAYNYYTFNYTESLFYYIARK